MTGNITVAWWLTMVGTNNRQQLSWQWKTIVNDDETHSYIQVHHGQGYISMLINLCVTQNRAGFMWVFEAFQLLPWSCRGVVMTSSLERPRGITWRDVGTSPTVGQCIIELQAMLKAELHFQMCHKCRRIICSPTGGKQLNSNISKHTQPYPTSFGRTPPWQMNLTVRVGLIKHDIHVQHLSVISAWLTERHETHRMHLLNSAMWRPLGGWLIKMVHIHQESSTHTQPSNQIMYIIQVDLVVIHLWYQKIFLYKY